ncbi:nucleoside phosphorylase [Azospirillum sp. TSO22-1]|uniref:phosphorylase family protein n=1 Tax=Azospirillum sp. TSO22-1 TaxID=716789 RepID=UPI000D604A83|nr:nucleoside phosphorylase [Azospirillum sp. TSO22-1]PWC52641.1 hypothetical protein TSO221_13490 [Azospirillum sp. TSO22-1]
MSGTAPLVACSGADADRAQRLAEEMVAHGATALVSFGLAGGLAHGLKAGTLLLASGVVLPDGSERAVSPAWRAAVLARAQAAGVSLSGGRIASVPRMAATPADKRALAGRSGSAAVDMESAAVALAAQDAGLPFLVLRAVADPPDATVPPLALAGVGGDGRLRPLRLVMHLLREPRSLPATLRLARDGHAGLSALRCALIRLGSLDPP